ncbi:MGDG synthase family glycosyltransferase [Gorillibacterium timonense]|uniref:MGDG synthase family glycosyltransferase n=1 Tax=Gorillibacterium timonense TaxID=1689269 RepID=UPI00071C3627|nr:glycosyltransferase [Gorillibacterium timonense]
MGSGQMHKILILTGDLGDGHIQAAGAIAEAARLYGPEAQTVLVNFPSVTHPKLHPVGRYFYTKWVTRFPLVYGYLFQKTRGENLMSQLFRKMKFYTLSRLERLIQEVRPTVIVTTFPPAAAGISMLKESGLSGLPAITVITDHTDHSYWLHPYTDRYIVASERVRDALVSHGIRESQISVTGIPVRPEFTMAQDRMKLRDKLGLDRERPVVLLMGGGLGMIAKESSSLLLTGDIAVDAQFVLICGRNRKLQESLAKELADCRHSITITGYVDNVHEWMAAADLLITKPGGLTTSEAIATGLPMLLYKPLPGQETDNSAFLVEAGVAIEAGHEKELAALLNSLLRNPERLAGLRRQAAGCRREHAAYEALLSILETDAANRPRKLSDALYARA